MVDRDLVQIALLGLEQEEEGALHVPGLSAYSTSTKAPQADPHLHLVHDRRNDDQAARLGVVRCERIPSPRDRHAVARLIHVLPDDVVLAANEDARGPLELVGRGRLPAGNWRVVAFDSAQAVTREAAGVPLPLLTLHEHVRPRISRLAPLAHNVIEPQIELVKRQHLFCALKCLAGRVAVGLFVARLERSVERVVVPDVDADERRDDRVGLVRLERRRGEDLPRGVAVEDVAQLGLFKAGRIETRRASAARC